LAKVPILTRHQLRLRWDKALQPMITQKLRVDFAIKNARKRFNFDVTDPTGWVINARLASCVSGTCGFCTVWSFDRGPLGNKDCRDFLLLVGVNVTLHTAAIHAAPIVMARLNQQWIVDPVRLLVSVG